MLLKRVSGPETLSRKIVSSKGPGMVKVPKSNLISLVLLSVIVILNTNKF